MDELPFPLPLFECVLKHDHRQDREDSSSDLSLVLNLGTQFREQHLSALKIVPGATLHQEVEHLHHLFRIIPVPHSVLLRNEVFELGSWVEWFRDFLFHSL